MATDRLRIYNGALLICEERTLSALTDNIEPRFLLDNVWNDGGVDWCLERGQWRFAMRSAKFTYDPSVTPSWGLRYAFPKPTDWKETCAVCTDPYFNDPLRAYADEAGYWFSDLDTIYVKMVSNDANYGLDLSKWPYSFTEFVKAYFASRICGKLGCSEAVQAKIIAPQKGVLAQNLLTAKNRDSMAGPTTFPARGSWVNSRAGRNRGWNDGGNRGSLIG